MTNEELLRERAELLPDRVVMKRRKKRRGPRWHCTTVNVLGAVPVCHWGKP